jgi:hypothetical protein
MATAAAPSLSSAAKIDLSKVAMISVSFHMGIGRVKQTKVKVLTSADESLLRHNKKLLESDELDAIRSADGSIRRWIERMTVPSISEGTYTLPHALLVEVVERLEAYREERQELIDAFLDAYDGQVAAARVALAEHFREADYPLRATVEAGFSFEYQFQSVEVPSDIQNIDSKIFQRAMETQQKKLEETGAIIRTALRTGVSEMVSHLANILTPTSDGKRKKLFDTSVTNIQDFLSNFNFRNVTDDVALQVEVDKLRSIMSGVSPEKVKESDNLKAKLQADLSAASKVLGQLVTDAPARRFR